MGANSTEEAEPRRRHISPLKEESEMKSFVFAIAAFTLVACVSSPTDRQDPLRTSVPSHGESAAVDMSPLMGNEVDLQKLLQLCVTQTGRSFTYDSNTGRALERTYIRWSNQARMSPADFETLVGQLLDASGFDLSPVGPAELRVFAVKLHGR
jgi:hypothetical protein